jgi:CoA-transferase family III
MRKIVLRAASGLRGLIGVDDQEPCKVQVPVVDVFTRYVGALGVVCRLLEGEKNGKGSSSPESGRRSGKCSSAVPEAQPSWMREST